MEQLTSFTPPAPEAALARPGLSSLLAEVTSLGPLTGREKVPQVVAWLQSAPSTEENGKELLVLLDADAFAGLSDEHGRPLKLEALLALLRMGYPWALQVKPEDLAWLREQQRPYWRRHWKGLLVLGLWTALTLEVAYFTLPLWMWW
ncbi:MAG: hypothetical protein IT380_24050 [Myxococcales bacterium]|nr:hypothetical protein [Myxococcales bacterium]